MTRRLVAGIAAFTALLLSASSWAQPVQVDPAIPAYQKTSGVSGNLNSIGSDTLNNLMTFWAEGFRKQYPNVRIQIEGKGSSTAPPALIAGTAQIGPMSRTMKDEELDEFEKRFGYKPTQIRVAVDALAVYVHKDNPLEKLTLTRGGRRSSPRPGAAVLRRRSTPGASSAWTAPGPAGPSASTAATRPRGPTATSRRSRSARATTGTASRSSRARRRWCRASPRTWTASATRASATGPRA